MFRLIPFPSLYAIVHKSSVFANSESVFQSPEHKRVASIEFFKELRPELMKSDNHIKVGNTVKSMIFVFRTAIHWIWSASHRPHQSDNSSVDGAFSSTVPGSMVYVCFSGDDM